MTFHVFALDAGVTATARVPALDGSVEMMVEARREGDRIDVHVHGASPAGGRQLWSVLLRDVESVSSVEGGTAQPDALGTRVMSDAGVQTVVVQLPEAAAG